MATICGVNKTDSNLVGLSIAEEDCLKVLPGTDTTNPTGLGVWYEEEPNSYSDFGGDVKTVVRAPINKARSRRKGTISGIDASGGYNTDVTLGNTKRLMQGFMFADARQAPSTKPMNGAAIAITAVAASDDHYGAAAGLAVIPAGSLVLASGFGVPTNNGLKNIVTSAAASLLVSQALADEVPTTAAKLQVVGKAFAAADVAFTFAAGLCFLTATAGVFNASGLIPGQWVFLGGDVAGSHFANNIGYARISSITAKVLTFDQTTWSPATEAATGIALQMFFGTVVRNETDPALIKRRSYNLERTLGSDAAGVQSEYLTGAVANEFTLNVPQEDKLTADYTFVACDNEQRTGLQGLKGGTRVAALGEDAINTSSDVYTQRMAVFDAADPRSAALFGFVSEYKLEIKNGVTPNKAVGVTGAFDTSAGDFEVGGSVTAYFTTVEATKAVRDNADVGIYSIFAARNAGIIYDTPLLSLGGGRLAVEKGSPITVPLDTNAAQSKFGHTLLVEFFDYLPNIAMPA